MGTIVQNHRIEQLMSYQTMLAGRPAALSALRNFNNSVPAYGPESFSMRLDVVYCDMCWWE